MESVMPMASKVDRWIRNVGSWISDPENWIVDSGFLQQVIYWVTVADDVTLSWKQPRIDCFIQLNNDIKRYEKEVN